MFGKHKQQKDHEADTAQQAVEVAELARATRALKSARLLTSLSLLPGVVPHEGEIAYLMLREAELIEPKHLSGHWTGDSGGVSLRAALGVRTQQGGTRGASTPGNENMEPIDVGLFIVTNQRCIFAGAKGSAEWGYATLQGFSVEGDGWVVFNVSKRLRATGVRYREQPAEGIDAVIAACVAQFQGENIYQALMTELEGTVAQAKAAVDRHPPVVA